jgi:N-terminal domain of anti-restriction factor ArdC
MATMDSRVLARERVSTIANDILTAFESGELPRALAQLFIHRKVEVPSRHWTWTNRLVAIRKGHVYAAGFRQWQALGRSVKKGEHAFHILAPRIARAKEDDEERGLKEGDPLTVGFLAVAVFGLSQTEGDLLPGTESESEFIDRLPLVEVARSWGLEVSLYAHEDAPDRLGYFASGRGIGLGVENLSTWAHEARACR